MTVSLPSPARKILVLVTAFLVSLLITNGLFVRNAFAATGSIYMSPSTSSVEKDKTLSVNVRINPGTNVDTVHIVVGYNTTLLTYVGLNIGGSAFDTHAGGTSVSGGSVTFNLLSLTGPVSTDSFIGTLTFTAKASSGSTSLSLTGSDAVSAGTSTNPGKTSATVNFTAPPVVTPPTTGGGTATPKPTTPSTSSTGGSSQTPSTSTKTPSTTTPTTTTPAGATPVTVGGVSTDFTQAKISVTSAQPTKVYARFGINDQLTTNTAESGMATSHSIVIDPSMLVPGTKYTYVVVSTNQQGVQSQTETQVFRTKGMPVSVKVVNASGKPLRTKQVTLHSDPQTVTTDKEGNAIFKDVAPGLHSLQYTADGKKYSQDITVLNNVQLVGDTQTASQQNFTVALDIKGGWGLIVPTMIVVLALGAVGVGAYLYNMKKRGTSFDAMALQPAAVVMADTPKLSKVSLVSSDGTSQPITPNKNMPEPGTIISARHDDSDNSSDDQSLEFK